LHFTSLGGNCEPAIHLKHLHVDRVTSPLNAVGSSPLTVATLLAADHRPGHSLPFDFPVETLDARHVGYEFRGTKEIAMRYNAVSNGYGSVYIQSRHEVALPKDQEDTPENRQRIGEANHERVISKWNAKWFRLIEQARLLEIAGGSLCFCYREWWPQGDPVRQHFSKSPSLRAMALQHMVTSLTAWCDRIGLKSWHLLLVTDPGIDWWNCSLLGDSFRVDCTEARPCSADDPRALHEQIGNFHQWSWLVSKMQVRSTIKENPRLWIYQNTTSLLGNPGHSDSSASWLDS
jgi:hypothetical protein